MNASVISKYAKAIGAVVVTTAMFIVSAATDGMSVQEWVMTAGLLVVSVNIAIVPNLDVGIATIAKTIVAFLTAGLATAAVLVIGGLTPTEVVEIIVAALASIGATALPNAQPPSILPGSARARASADAYQPDGG